MKLGILFVMVVAACGDDGGAARDAAGAAPSFAKGADQAVDEDAPAQSVAWATAIDANDPGETVSFEVTAADPSLFATPPAIASDGTLTYTVAPDAFGATQVTVVAHDSGGASSAAATFGIEIASVNDVPTYDVLETTVTVDEDTGTHTVQWLDHIVAGPANEQQTPQPNFSFDTTRFVTAPFPSIDATGLLTFTLEPNMTGSFDFNYQVSDGLLASTTATLHLVVTNIDDPPMTNNDSFQVYENEPVPVSFGAAENDPDVDGPPPTIISLTQPAHGTAAIDAANAQHITYKPNTEYCNSNVGDSLDEFDYTIVGGLTGHVAMTVVCTSTRALTIDMLTDIGVALQYTPVFDPDQSAFAVTLPVMATSVRVKVKPEDNGAAIQLNGGGLIRNTLSDPIAIDPGSTRDVVVTMKRLNRVDRVYTIHVTRN